MLTGTQSKRNAQGNNSNSSNHRELHGANIFRAMLLLLQCHSHQPLSLPSHAAQANSSSLGNRTQEVFRFVSRLSDRAMSLWAKGRNSTLNTHRDFSAKQWGGFSGGRTDRCIGRGTDDISPVVAIELCTCGGTVLARCM